MKKEKISIPYKIILKRFWGVSCFGRLKITTAKMMVTRNLRFGIENWNSLYKEMKDLEYISFMGKKGGLQIEIPLKDLV